MSIRQVETSRELGERGVQAFVVPVVAVAIVRFIGGSVLVVPPAFRPLQWASVIAVTAVAAVAATLVYALLDRFTAATARNFLALAAVTFVVLTVPLATMVPDLPGATPTLTAILFVLHLVAAVGIVVPLLRDTAA